MPPLATTITTVFAGLTLISQIAIVGLLVLYFTSPGNSIVALAARYAYPLAWLVALSAALISLFYSDILGFDPCKLCWWQRIFMYPMAILFSVALVKKERVITDYAIWLSLTGLAIAVYQYYGQMFNPGIFSCGIGGGSSCSQRFFVEFGYMTIPMMSLTAFAMILLLMFLEKKRNKHY